MAHMLIAGGGQAAATAAETLRAEGFDGGITLVAAEAHEPYQRPPLSKGYLAGREDRDAVILHDRSWYDARAVELRTGVAVVRLDTGARRAELSDGSAVGYDAVLVATGAQPRTLAVPGAGLDGVLSLRRLDQADALAAALRGGGRRLVIVGGGWIGLEVAATARGLGNEVTVLHRGDVPLEAALGEEMGAVFRELHRERGVRVRARTEACAILGKDRVEGVDTGVDAIPADLVVVGIGAAPDTALAEASGLGVRDGIPTDAGMRTRAPGVWAAGDVANPYHPVIQRHLRVEHWANARAGGRVAARSMLGGRARLDGVPYFFSDQYDLGMELSGYPPLMSGARVVVRGDIDAREFIAFWVDDGRVVGGMNVNVWDVNEQVQALIRSGTRVPPDRLRDPDLPLGELTDP